jgi:hypothetical protein
MVIERHHEKIAFDIIKIIIYDIVLNIFWLKSAIYKYNNNSKS